MNMTGILTCRYCLRETPWPFRCDCQTSDPTTLADVIKAVGEITNVTIRNPSMDDTPRTKRFLATIDHEKLFMWQVIEAITEWARGLERECASLEGPTPLTDALRDKLKLPQSSMMSVEVFSLFDHARKLERKLLALQLELNLAESAEDLNKKMKPFVDDERR